jgi:hypothetical protein
MDTPHNEFPHPTKSQKTGYYLMVSIILGTGIYFLAQGIAQLWQ